MSTEREHTHAQHDPSVAPTQDDLSPGLMSRSAKLDAPEKPLASGLIARKATRDDNGVADGADAAVAKAGSSSGSSLPEPIMRKFESSLGADLSSVRVHTGADSASAASAVGAKAYTMGQDIHFGAGHYDPASGSGQHLLAHEVAHTVQQRGGSPVRQNKLEVSSPHDAAEHEADHAADAMVAGHAATIGTGAGIARAVIHRDADKTPDPYPGKPPTPFDDANIPPAVIEAIDTLAIDTMRSLTEAQVNRAYASYLKACTDVSTKLNTAWVKKQGAQQEMVDIAIGVMGLALGGVGAAIGGKLATVGPGIQGSLIAKVETALPKALLTRGVDAQTRERLVGVVLEKVTGERITKLMTTLTPEKATGLVGTASAKVAGLIARVNTAGTVEEKSISYVDALVGSSSASASALLDAVGGCSDLGTLVGVHSQFASASVDMYRAEVDLKARNFAVQIASTIGSNADSMIVCVNAYGRERLATVHYLESSANYTFKSWVTPDMEPAVRLLNPNPMRLATSMILGHLPEPVMEGAMMGQELVMRTNAWGQDRLVTVKSERTRILSSEVGLVFVGWVSPDQEVIARAKGAAQIGGITQVDPGKIHGLTAPSADPH